MRERGQHAHGHSHGALQQLPKVLTESFVFREGGRRSPERRFDGLASLEVKRTCCHPGKNQSDKTFGNQICPRSWDGFTASAHTILTKSAAGWTSLVTRTPENETVQAPKPDPFQLIDARISSCYLRPKQSENGPISPKTGSSVAKLLVTGVERRGAESYEASWTPVSAQVFALRIISPTEVVDGEKGRRRKPFFCRACPDAP